jgi:hypothetical protein
MKTAKFHIYLVAALALAASSALAQSQYLFTFHGTCWTTNAAGQWISHPSNNKTLIQDYALTKGLTSTKSLILVYHLNSEDRGDTVDLVDTSTGQIVDALFAFFFATAFDRADLVSADGQQQKRIDYVYGHQIDHSVGSALTDLRFTRGANGKTNRALITGQMDFLVLPDAKHPTLQICNGNFTTGKAVTFPPAH